MRERVVEAFFWVGKRGEASPEPDAITGMPVPDQSEASRFVAVTRVDVLQGGPKKRGHYVSK